MSLKFTKKEKLLTKDSTITFGKYKGDTINRILGIDPQYIVWCIENIKWFKVDTFVNDVAYERASEDFDLYDGNGYEFFGMMRHWF